MKLHLPKGLLTAVLAVVGAWAGLANAETTTPAYSGTVYTFKGYNSGTDLAFSRLEYTDGEGNTATITGQSGSWGNISNAIATPTAGADRNTLKFVEDYAVDGGLKYTFDPIAVAGFIVDGAGYSIIPGSTGGKRNIEIGNTNSTAAYSSINYSFTLNNSARTDSNITLHGTQTWDIANAAVFTLNTGDGNIQLSSGSSTTQVGGKVDFSGKSVTGSGAYTVSSGTLANATFATGTTLGVGTSAVFDAVTMQSGSIVDLTSLTMSEDSSALQSSKIILNDGVSVKLNSLKVGDVVNLYDDSVSLGKIYVGDTWYSAKRSTTESEGTITVTGLVSTFSDMVWAGGESGTWNSTNTNWNSATGGDGITFVSGDTVAFNSSSTVTVGEAVSVGGMTVSGAQTIVTMSIADNSGGYIQGAVTVTDGAKLVLDTKTNSTGFIRGTINVANGTLQYNKNDLTGYGGGANCTTLITVASGSTLALNHATNETFTGSLVLNGTLKGLSTNAARWDLYKGTNNAHAASITVEDGNNAVIQNVNLQLRQNDSVITVGNNATLTMGGIGYNRDESNGILVKNGSGSITATGSFSMGGITLNAGTMTLQSTNTNPSNIGNISAKAGVLNLNGGSFTASGLDLSDNSRATARVNVNNASSLVINGALWGCAATSINIGEGSSVTASDVKVIGTANATTIAASQNGLYGTDNVFTITNATVEVAPAAESSTTLGNKIVDSNVSNTGDGELIVSDMTVTDASKVQSALTGDMTVTKLTLASGLSETVAAVTTSGALTLGSITLDLTGYVAGNYTLVSATGDGSITWNDSDENALSYTGTLGEGLKASVDFVGSDKKTLQLTISEMVTPGESLITTTVVEKHIVDGVEAYLYSLEGTTLTLTVESLAGLAEGGIVELNLISDEMKAAILASLTNPETGKVTEMVTLKLTDGNTDNDIIAGEDAIVGFFNEKHEGYFGENVGNGVQYNVNLIPEPTTATLSLLALMGLAARRRRK